MTGLATKEARIKLLSLDNLIIPVSLVIMTGTSITFLNTLSSANNRWIILISLAVALLLKRSFFKYFDNSLFIILYFYLGWCFSTSFWSLVPSLSFMKSVMMIIAVFTLIRTGIEWVRVNSWTYALDYLWLLALFSLLAGFLGNYAPYDVAHETMSYQTTILYQGLVKGTNMFGMLMSMSLPFMIWQTYKFWSNIRRRIFWMILTGSCLFFLILSISRSAIIMSCFTCAGFFFSLKFNKRLKTFLLSVIISILILLLLPFTLEDISGGFRKLVFKGRSDSSLFVSRQIVWKQSLDAAMNAGFIGFGYGVSEGKNEFTIGEKLQSYAYGREKGNSQLAVMEETGIFGLLLYLLVIYFLLSKLLILFFKANDPDLKVLIGILFGLFLGLIMHSMLEAWWSSPGSPESIYFWMLIGVIKGLEILSLKEWHKENHGRSKLY
ncbi:MAG TPA: O-antigen ligase family protein [Gammaproteobacteria bacterium]|nr:MAG: hypothetical protein A3E83_06585 [Gammaproteobacteria bacterium RIFCSPHIGHO2_12_FULL_41_20]HLB43576.1 O-antigen ligase family protein [Gammaproteobacteria bacterium]